MVWGGDFPLLLSSAETSLVDQMLGKVSKGQEGEIYQRDREGGSGTDRSFSFVVVEKIAWVTQRRGRMQLRPVQIKGREGDAGPGEKRGSWGTQHLSSALGPSH